MTFEQMLIDWIPTWIILSIVFIGGLSYYRMRTNYKKVQMKELGKEKKNSETIDGAIGSLLNDAPKNFKQVESEIASIRAQGLKDGLTEEQIHSLTQRLESERDMLGFAVKYGNLAKPLLKPLSGFVTKILGGLGN